MFDMFTGGALGRMTVFALNIMPYISAQHHHPADDRRRAALEALKKEGEAGRKKLNQYTRYLTVFIAVFQAYGIAVGLESMRGSFGPAVLDPGLFFRISCVVTLVGGTMFLMWLGEQITARGIGNGISPDHLRRHRRQPALGAGRDAGARPHRRAVDRLHHPVPADRRSAVIALVVFVERAQRRIPVQYPKRQVGNRMFGGETTHLPLKLNTSGVIPPIFASLPAAAAGDRRGLLGRPGDGPGG